MPPYHVDTSAATNAGSVSLRPSRMNSSALERPVRAPRSAIHSRAAMYRPTSAQSAGERRRTITLRGAPRGGTGPTTTHPRRARASDDREGRAAPSMLVHVVDLGARRIALLVELVRHGFRVRVAVDR